MMNKPKGWQKDSNTHSRTNWTDPSLKFLDWVNTFEFEKTFLGKIGSLLETKLRLRFVSVLFLGCLGLSYIVFFSFDVPYHAQIGAVAHNSINSPIAIDVVDDITTESRRVQAEMAVPPVFDYEAKISDDIASKVYKSFELMRTHRTKKMTAKDFLPYQKDFEKALDQEVPQRVFEWLAEKKFNLELENNIIRTFEHWSSEQRLAESPGKFIGPDHDKVIIRLIYKDRSPEEFAYPTKAILDINNQDLFTLDGISGLKRLVDRDRLLLKQFTYSILRPNLTYNKTETEDKREKARAAVLPVIISIKKNQTIIHEGSIVEPIQVAILEKVKDQTSNQRKDFLALNLAALLVIIILTFMSFTKRFSVNLVRIEKRDFLAMGAMSLLAIVTCKFFWFLADLLAGRFGAVLPEGFYLFAAPVAIAPMVVSLLVTYGEIVWLYTVFLAVILSFLVSTPYPILVYTAISGIAAARGVFKCNKRNDIYFAGLKTGFVNGLSAVIISLATQHVGSNWVAEVPWITLAGLISGIVSAFLALSLVSLFEGVLGYTTDVKLMELSNLNHPLMQEMVVKAPGTYHHSLVVGSMVEAASEKIGANPLLAKVMAYYHDIGKTSHAGYFIENQRPGRNPHDHISPFMSKTVLIAHIKDGVELGIRYKLGKPIIDGILQHHGTTLIAYFFNKSVETQDENNELVPEDEFRYPGPKPQFKEAALIMLADSIEAAARSLDEPTPMRLQNIVKNIIQRKFMDGQLEECTLTLKDLSIIEKSFIRTLLGIHHQRIDYPKQAGGGASLPPEKPNKNGSRKIISST